MKGKVKLIGMDLDGTLLTTKKELTLYTKAVLKRAAEQGITVLPATGRPLSGLTEELVEFQGFRYAVTANGGRVVDIRSGETLFQDLVPVETARKVLEILGHYDSLREIYFDGTGYAQEDALKEVGRYLEEPPVMEYIMKTRIAVPDLWEKFEEENRELDKVQGLFASMEERSLALEELKEVPGIEITGALRKNIEVNGAGVNKGRALVRLGQRLGISREEIMAFGDGANDLQMLKEVGIGVAMENAKEELKEAADYIAGTNDEDGVARFIEAYVLNG